MADNKWKKKSGLGKGLSALLENTEEKETLSGSGATIRGAIDQIDINQISGTCVSGAGNTCSSPDAKIIMDIDSDNATIQINQKDSSNDS